MFTLIYCFSFICAGIAFANYLPPLLGNVVNQEDYIAEERIALNSLVATDDVLKYWNQSDSVKGFGSSWIILPDGNGTAKVAVMQDEDAKTNLSVQWSFDDQAEANENVKFQLYNEEHPEGINFTIDSLDTIEFTKKDGVKIICHGWRADGQSDIIQGIKNAYLEEQNVNVIGVDWSYGADSIFYNICAKKTSAVGKTIGMVIDKLTAKFDLPYEDFHIIGHSLGAHIAGFAGRNTKSKIGRITGLDPALPGFQYVQLAGGRLDKEDAQFVDVIHSCASSLGMSVPVGHVDFYPNGGSPMQPGCPQTDIDYLPVGLDTVACSHARSYQFFEESVKNTSDFTAVKCDSWMKFKYHNCFNDFTIMGEKVQQSSRGIYYLKTNDHTPFYLGINGTIF